MNENAQELVLRPLGIGEIFDRAVTLYVRNALTFSIIAAFVVVPISIVSYFAQSQQAGTLEQILKQAQHPSPVPATPLLAPWYLLTLVVALLAMPFMYVAMAGALASIYQSRPADWRAAYGVALRHAGGILMLVLSGFIIYFGAVLIGVFTLGILFVIVAAALTYVKVVGIILAIPAAAASIAFVLGIMLCYLAVALAFEAVGVEEVPFMRAIGSGFVRVFNRSELGRATLVCLAFAVMQLVLVFVSFAVVMLIGQLPFSAFLQTIVQCAISLVTTGFMGVLIAVYYFDVRIRREGMDVQAAIDSLQTQPQA